MGNFGVDIEQEWQPTVPVFSSIIHKLLKHLWVWLNHLTVPSVRGWHGVFLMAFGRAEFAWKWSWSPGSLHLIRSPHSGEQLTCSMQNSRSSEGELGKGLGTGCYSPTQLEYVYTHGCSHRTYSTHCNPLEWNDDNRKGLPNALSKLRSGVRFPICGAYCIIILSVCVRG